MSPQTRSRAPLTTVPSKMSRSLKYLMVSSMAARNASSDPMSSIATLVGALEVASMLLVMWAVAPVDGCRDDRVAPAGSSPRSIRRLDRHQEGHPGGPINEGCDWRLQTCSLPRLQPASASNILLCLPPAGPTLPISFRPEGRGSGRWVRNAMNVPSPARLATTSRPPVVRYGV